MSRHEDVDVFDLRHEADGQGTVLLQIRARRGQTSFRRSLVDRYGARCMISGCTLLDVIEAAHIKPYRSTPDHHPANGLLLRADLHTLFDLDLLGIDPDTLVVHLHPEAQASFSEVEGNVLRCSTDRPSKEALALRWSAFCARLATDDVSIPPGGGADAVEGARN